MSIKLKIKPYCNMSKAIKIASAYIQNNFGVSDIQAKGIIADALTSKAGQTFLHEHAYWMINEAFEE